MSDYPPYLMTLRVPTPDLDAWNRLRTASLLRYLEQLATAASTAVGCGPAWYAARQSAWVIRTSRLQRLGDAAYSRSAYPDHLGQQHGAGALLARV